MPSIEETQKAELLAAVCQEGKCTIEDVVIHLQQEMVNKEDLESLLIEIQTIKEQQSHGIHAIKDLRIAEKDIKKIKDALKSGSKTFEEIKELIRLVEIEATRCERESDFLKLETFQKEILFELKSISEKQEDDRNKLKHEEELGVIRNGKAESLTEKINQISTDMAFLRGKAEGQTESKSNSWKQWQLYVAAAGMIIAFVTVLLSVTGVI